MIFWLLLFVLTATAIVLFRNARGRRRQWVQQLALPGHWIVERTGDDTRGVPDASNVTRLHAQRAPRSLELRGSLTAGDYVESWLESSEGEARQVVERGRWRLNGGFLDFEPESGAASRCELRLFEVGKIGLNGAGRDHLIYRRQATNVVPLRSTR